MLDHILETDVRALHTNPRFVHTYVDEDAMRWAKQAARRCAPSRLEWGLLRRARLRLHSMRWVLRGLKRKRQ